VGARIGGIPQGTADSARIAAARSSSRRQTRRGGGITCACPYPTRATGPAAAGACLRSR
jgi:hypothetical protein